MQLTTLPITSIGVDPDMQAREQINEDVVTRYTQAMDAGRIFPPLTVFVADGNYWLADGWHRLRAYNSIDQEEVSVEVHQGTRRDALLYTFGTNDDHGWQRTDSDIDRAIMAMLEDEEWGQWSDREIARRCKVEHSGSWRTKIGQLRPILAQPGQYETGTGTQERTFTHPKTGEQTTMATAKIGGKKKKKAKAAATAKPGKPKDALGYVIEDPVVVEVFEQVGEIEELRSLIRKAKKLATALRKRPVGDELGQSIEIDLRNAGEAAKFAVPHTICPNHKPGECPACQGRGWITKLVFERLPAESKDRF
jgi:hypothetical protein